MSHYYSALHKALCIVVKIAQPHTIDLVGKCSYFALGVRSIIFRFYTSHNINTCQAPLLLARLLARWRRGRCSGSVDGVLWVRHAHILGVPHAVVGGHHICLLAHVINLQGASCKDQRLKEPARNASSCALTWLATNGCCTYIKI